MGNSSMQRINFEDIQYAQQHDLLIINTLPSSDQGLLISKTVSWQEEIHAVEHAIRNKKNIFVYGRHSNDETIYIKYQQIQKLGGKVYLYTGGLFEWLLLQDIYGASEFATTATMKLVDVLKYKPPTLLNTKYLTYSWQGDC
jgi:hypothetical protein